ncbi:MAG: TrpR YerC/YecD [Eubacterium sp.]|nr:TrpR YerC/YecD [Eubacterium sp.]
MSKKVKNEETRRLMEGIASLADEEECYAFFEDLCTANELLSLAQRFAVAGMLRQGMTYQEIVEKTGASSTTISRVNRSLNFGTDGYDLVLDRIKKEPE